MKTFKTYPPVSKASKPKGKGWERNQRFSTGHDAGCLALLPEEMRLGELLPAKPRRVKAAVWRAATLNMTREQRIVDDALFLVNHGFAADLEEAVEKALKNNPQPEYSAR